MSHTGKVSFVIIFLVLIGTGCLFFMRDTSPNLLKRASHLNVGEMFMGVNSSFLASGSGDVPYYWLSNDELLCLTPNQQVGSYALHRVNVVSGADTVAGSLPTQNFRLSPDGKWALTIVSSHAGSLFTVERTDGKRQFRFFTHIDSQDTNLAWSPDDRTLFALTFPDTGATLGTFPLDKPAVLPNVPISLHDNQILLGILPDNRILAIQNIHDKQLSRIHSAIEVYDFSPVANSPIHKTEVAKLEGSGSEVEDVVLSPSGDRLAWQITTRHTLLFYSVFKNVYNAVGASERTSVSLWTSKLDGSDRRVLGSLTLKSPLAAPHFLRWTPDGQKLSFLYQGNLYSLPAK